MRHGLPCLTETHVRVSHPRKDDLSRRTHIITRKDARPCVS